MNKLSVITITYNNYDELIHTLSTIPSGDFIESIVINGGECEKTRDYLEQYEGVTLSESDRGISDAFNKGLDLATGDFLIFLNSGDFVIDPNYYSYAANYLANNPEIDFVHGIIETRDVLGNKGLVTPNSETSGKMPFIHPSLMIKRKVFEKVGYFRLDYRVAMDFDYVYRMIKAGFKGHYYENPVIHMIPGGVSVTLGLRGLEERMEALSNVGMHTPASLIHLNILRAKTHTRHLLGSLGLLEHYDRLKYRFIKTREE